MLTTTKYKNNRIYVTNNILKKLRKLITNNKFNFHI